MSPAESPKVPRILPHIPLEVLRIIADHIDVPSALALCRTAKGLRDAGEMKVYETINLTSDWDPATQTSDTMLTLKEYYARASIVISKLDAIIPAASSHPLRMQSIRAIRIEPFDWENSGLAEVLVTLLRATASTIRRLDILPLPVSLRRAKLDFPQLVKLRYGLSADGMQDDRLDPLDEWLSRMENLQEIEYCCADRDGYGCSPDLKRARKPLLHLKRITINQLDDSEPDIDSGQQILATLLDMAPNVEFLRMKGIWCPRRGEPALLAIAGAKHLKTVVALSGEAEAGMGYRDGLSYERLGKAEMPFEELVIYDETWGEVNELQLENLRLPKANNLKRLTILTTPRPSLTDYISLSLDPTPSAVAHINLYFLAYIERNPQLTSILFLFLEHPFPATYHAHSVEPEYWVDPLRWEVDGHRGALIRQYTSPSGSEKLWHIRGLSRSRLHPSGLPYVGVRRCWTDYAHYEGRTVPREILEKVYDLSGLEMDSVDAGRDLQLGGDIKEWDVLRQWREGAGDESEVDDDYSDAGVEGSEMDTEDDE